MTVIVPDNSSASTYPITGGVNATTNYVSAFTGSESTLPSTATSNATFNSYGQQTSSDALPGGSLSSLPGGTSETGLSSSAPLDDPTTLPATSSLAQNTSTKNVIVGGVVVLVVVVGGYYLIRSKLDIVKDVADIVSDVKSKV